MPSDRRHDYFWRLFSVVGHGWSRLSCILSPAQGMQMGDLEANCRLTSPHADVQVPRLSTRVASQEYLKVRGQKENLIRVLAGLANRSIGYEIFMPLA